MGPIIKTLLVCGRQGLALRGHQDSRKLSLDQPEENDGNFRALLRMRIESGDDTTLRNHVTTCPKNASYLNPEIQYELLDLSSRQIQDVIVKEINSSKCFSVIADETTDVAGISQMALCARYVTKLENRHVIKESFLTFAAVESGTGEAIAIKMKNELERLGIESKYLHGQGYDGCSAMKGNVKGVQAKVKERINPNALYVHCSSHSLNLALTDACKIKDIRNTFQSLNEVFKFVRSSAKWSSILAKISGESQTNFNHTTLLSFCETRFVERHSSVLRFVELYDCIIDVLEILENEGDANTSNKAHQLLVCITNIRFVLPMCVIEKIFSITISLSRQLQSPDLDLLACLEMAENILLLLTDMQQNAAQEFSKIFKVVSATCAKQCVSVDLPRSAKLDFRKCAAGSENLIDAESFYRSTIFEPFLESVIESVTLRYRDHKNVISRLQRVIPIYLGEANFGNELYDFYQDQVPDGEEVFNSELQLWKAKWNSVEVRQKPRNALETLDQCDPMFFPNVNFLLRVLATLPVTTCSSERSFSTLRQLKNYLRNTTGEDRLTSLGVLYIHRNYTVDVNLVIEQFVTIKRRWMLS